MAKQEILSLATDFPRLWRDEKTSDRDRKRIVRLLIEDVTLTREPEVIAKVRLKGGALQTLRLGKPQRSWESWQTDPEVIEQIDRLLNECTDKEIAEHLNRDGFKSGKGGSFTPRVVGRLRSQYQLKSRYVRLREAGMLTEGEIAAALGIHRTTVRRWLRTRLHRMQDTGVPSPRRSVSAVEDRKSPRRVGGRNRSRLADVPE